MNASEDNVWLTEEAIINSHRFIRNCQVNELMQDETLKILFSRLRTVGERHVYVKALRLNNRDHVDAFLASA
jgi:hypothetical protein